MNQSRALPILHHTLFLFYIAALAASEPVDYYRADVVVGGLAPWALLNIVLALTPHRVFVKDHQAGGKLIHVTPREVLDVINLLEVLAVLLFAAAVGLPFAVAVGW